MKFKNRVDAGQQLAHRLAKYQNDPNAIVLAIPRGGVPVASQVAHFLHLRLDISLARKLGVPGHEELAFGAVAANDGRYLNFSVIRTAKLSEAQIESITQRERKTLEDLTRQFRNDRPAPDLKGKTVLLIDDGIATGASIFATVRALRALGVGRLVIGVPVAPRATCAWLDREVDELITLEEPGDFYAVGQFYEDFSQTNDEEVVRLLEENRPEQHPLTPSLLSGLSGDVSIPLNGSALLGSWTGRDTDNGIVLFVHGSGSGKDSARNAAVASILHQHHLSTLLFNLLTVEEDLLDRRSQRYRFDIELLTRRLIRVTEWVALRFQQKPLPIFYFGASTGAAAALTACARLRTHVKALVCRGGRVDLAQDDLKRVMVPTLLLVGALDEVTLAINRHALDELGSRRKQLIVVPQAGHLFEEAGALESVASLAADWFTTNLYSD